MLLVELLRSEGVQPPRTMQNPAVVVRKAAKPLTGTRRSRAVVTTKIASVSVAGVAGAPCGNDVIRVVPLARLPLVGHVVHVAGELQVAPTWRVEIPEVVGAEDMAAGPDKGLPAFFGETPASHHHLVEVADMKLDVM